MTTQVRLKEFGLLPRKFRLRLEARRQDKAIRQMVLRSLTRSVPQATMSDDEYAQGMFASDPIYKYSSPYSNHFGSE
jgi:hypothetical protein